MNVYYTILPVIDISQHYHISSTPDGAHHLGTFQVRHEFMLADKNPIDILNGTIEKTLGMKVNLQPSDHEKALEEYRNDPKNWPSQEDCDCCCHCHGSIGLGMTCCD